MSDGITQLTPEQIAKQAYQATHEGYIHRVVEEEDVAVNVAFGGKQDETISSRCARAAQRGKWWGVAMSKFLDVFQSDHGARAEAGDLGRAEVVAQIEHTAEVNPED